MFSKNGLCAIKNKLSSFLFFYGYIRNQIGVLN